jgi:predicted nucleic acid-binding protein
MGIKVIEINKEIAEKSASIKSQYKFFKTADSLQLATALVHNCELFITNDKQLRQFSDIETLILDDLL